LIINLLVVVVFYKELKISSFDPELATTLGINATVMHYLLMTLVAVTTVSAFESVGSILVVAMLIVPAATAHLLTDRLPSMILVSLIVAFLAAVGGHLTATTIPTAMGLPDTNTAGMMAVVAGLLFTLALLAAPRHGIVSKIVHRALLTLRIAREDLLGLFYRMEELTGGPRTAPVAAVLHETAAMGPWLRSAALRGLVRASELERRPDGYQLTPQGRDAARQLIRSHRLWEGFLQTHLGLPVDHVHAPAERLEHVTSAAMREELAAKTDQPATDPQGKAIPPT
jgi:manganese/zinc/iron transport system permease protein